MIDFKGSNFNALLLINNAFVTFKIVNISTFVSGEIIVNSQIDIKIEAQTHSADNLLSGGRSINIHWR
ncbi:hypothetical protein D3C72_2505810 [compost metagenome]